MLLGDEAMEKLKNAHVAVFGLGGVGSWCAEALARSGVGRLTLIDRDFIADSLLRDEALDSWAEATLDKVTAACEVDTAFGMRYVGR